MYQAPKVESIKTDIEEVMSLDLPWQNLYGKKVLITGGSGMLAAYIADTLMMLPEKSGCEAPAVTVTVRNEEKAEKRFESWLQKPNFSIVTTDICNKDEVKELAGHQIIIHAASIPRPDREHPVDVMAPNIVGSWNLLELAQNEPDFEQFLYFSSGIVNGENIKSDVPITEEMYFSSSCTSPVACYSEGKRAGETICLSFMKQFGVPVKILRYFGSYGPGMDLNNDPRAFTSFIKNAVQGENITLLSPGAETRFWCYITDATDAFFRVLFSDSFGEVWNVANDEGGCTIRELADAACEMSPADVCVIFDEDKVPAGYSPFKSDKITVPGIAKLRSLGFSPKIDIQEGMRRSVNAYI